MGNPSEPPANPAQVIAFLQETALFGKEGEHGQEASQLMRKAHLHGPHAAFEVVVKLGHWDEDENLAIHHNEVAVEFAAEVERAAMEVQWPAQAAASRRWWRGKVWGWAEANEACERAFSVRRTWRGYRVGIHIASLALLLASTGALYHAAFERGASIHAPGCLVPMLPAPVQYITGLTATERKPCLTIAVELDRRCAVKAYSLGVWKVQLNGHLTFRENQESAIPAYSYWLIFPAICAGIAATPAP
tara:strand:- start:25 stop:765 length:741 start_codon:yes stop_codon:yes gene_type:complete